MKIGIVTQSYYPVLGGVTEHVWHLGRELQRLGHEVVIITGQSRTPDDRSLRVIRIGRQIPLSGSGANIHITVGWKLGRALQRIEAAEKFDLVHIQSPVDPGLPLIASLTMRSPKVGTHHSYRDRHTLADFTFRTFRRIFDRAVKNIAIHIAVSPSAAELIHRYYPNLPVEVIPNGIDTERFSTAVEPIAKYRDGVFTILFVGRMDPRKGAKYLFAALPYLEDKLERYRLLVVGSGWMKRYYHAHIPMHLQHRVEFAGFASPAELPHYYRSADVYCSPATGNESFGIVLLEAMSSGIPVVASNISGYRHVMQPDRQGLFVRPRDPQDLARAIIELSSDPTRRTSMGLAGRERAQDFNWQSVTQKILTVYQTVVNG